MVLGFKTTILRTWVSSHRHKNRAPTQESKFLHSSIQLKNISVYFTLSLSFSFSNSIQFEVRRCRRRSCLSKSFWIAVKFFRFLLTHPHPLPRSIANAISRLILRSKPKLDNSWGSSCDSVGSAFASDTRDPPFESSHRQILFTINCIKIVFKRRKWIKRGREWPF